MWKEKVGESARVVGVGCWSGSCWSAGVGVSTVEREALKLEFFVTKKFFF